MLCLAAAVSGASIVAVAAPAAAQTLPTDDPSRGLIYSGLRRGEAGTRCEGAYEILSRRAPTARPRLRCTHGPDPVPRDVDLRPGQDPQFRAGAEAPSSTLAQASAVPGAVPCYGNGTDGYRVQLVYAREATTTDRFASYEATFREWAARMDDVVNTSAAATGGVRHIRFVTDSQCRPVITHITLSASAVNSFDTTLDELDDRGFDRSDRKYLLWVDTPKTKYCGIGILYDDTGHDPRPGINVHNGNTAYPGLVARVDTRCWGQANMVEVHELLHTLGGVQGAATHLVDSAPHASALGHCTDESDRLCYADEPDGRVRKPSGALTSLTFPCAASHESLLDCNHDDYFHTNPPGGSYLATRWNTAESAWLERSPPAGTPGSAIAGSTWFSDGTNNQSGPAGTTIRAYAVGAFQNVPYLLVTGRDGGTPGQPCRVDLVPANTAPRYANSAGFVSTTVGTVNRLPGTYQVCFAQIDPIEGPRAVTGVTRFTVT